MMCLLTRAKVKKSFVSFNVIKLKENRPLTEIKLYLSHMQVKVCICLVYL